MSEIDDLSRALIAQTSRVFRYRDAVLGNGKGFARLHRKIDACNKRIDELMLFIDRHQLGLELENCDNRVAMERKAAWTLKCQAETV